MPDERRHAVQRARRRGEALQRRAELALPVDDVLAPQPVQQRVVLDGERDALADVLAEPRVDRAGVAAAHHQVDPAVREVLEHRVVLGDLHRVVGGDQGGGRRQDQVLGAGRDVAEHRRRRRRDERRVVVLAGREDVEADLLGLQRDGDHRLDPLVLGRRPSGRRVGGDVTDGEDPELHMGSLPVVANTAAQPLRWATARQTLVCRGWTDGEPRLGDGRSNDCACTAPSPGATGAECLPRRLDRRGSAACVGPVARGHEEKPRESWPAAAEPLGRLRKWHARVRGRGPCRKRRTGPRAKVPRP